MDLPSKKALSFIKSEEGDGVSVDIGDAPVLPWLEKFLRTLPRVGAAR